MCVQQLASARGEKRVQRKAAPPKGKYAKQAQAYYSRAPPSFQNQNNATRKNSVPSSTTVGRDEQLLCYSPERAVQV